MGAFLTTHLATAHLLTPSYVGVVVAQLSQLSELILLLLEERLVDGVRSRQSRALLVGEGVAEGVPAVGRGRVRAHLGLEGLEDEGVDAALVRGDPGRESENNGG